MAEKQILGEREREQWLWFHENAYQDDLKIAEKLLVESPRWSIISGYYAMHDITKLYLGKIKGWKVSGSFVHSRVIELLEESLKEYPRKQEIICLLREAEKEIKEVLRIEEKTIVKLLRTGKSERGKAQYYSEKSEREMFNINFSRKSTYFFEKIVKPYTKIIRGLL